MRSIFLLALLLTTALAFASESTERAVSIRPTNIFLSPSSTSQKLSPVLRGRDLDVLDHSGNWIHVIMATEGEGTGITGWVEDKAVITTKTPNADEIVFGEAVDSEHEAEKRNGRRDAAKDAMRLYDWIAGNMPHAPRAGEAMYRAGDIRWQIEKADASTLPSAKEKDPYMRHQIDEDYLRQVIKKYPDTRWADLAAFDLIDNKLCGDWQGDPKCPLKESELYEKYAAAHPNSPKLAEALYDAAWRQGALIDLYTAAHDEKKADAARARAIATAQRIATRVQR